MTARPTLKLRPGARTPRTKAPAKAPEEIHRSKQEARKQAKKFLRSFAVISEHKPLAVGIHRELIAAAPQGTATVLRKVLHWHTVSAKYLSAVAEPNSQRHDLSGAPVQPVSDDARAWAQQQLASK